MKAKAGKSGFKRHRLKMPSVSPPVRYKDPGAVPVGRARPVRERRVLYLHNPSGDIGHAVHLLRLLSELNKVRGGRNLIFLRAPKVYPYGMFKKYGRVVPLPAAPSASSGRRLASMVAELGPSVAVTEFFPFGRPECLPEIMPALAAASCCGAKIHASVPMPYFTAQERGLKDMFRACAGYDKILVHSPEGADLPYMAKAVSLERRVSPAAFLSAFGELRGKVVFTGYLVPAPLGRRVKEEDLILVTRGGGSTSDRFFEAAIGAAAIVDRPFLFVAGPATSPGRLAYFRRLAAAGGGNARVISASAELSALMARAAVCVSTAGGTVYEMLALRKKMLLAPFCGASGLEHSDQLARALLMKELAGAELLLPGDIDPEKIAAALSRRLLAPLKISKRVRPAWFRGAARSAEIISS